ncbi:MAG: quinol monooxygenase YgiN [Limisphaerales bacterium]|jgi:quinol monooxygenase YgiN
MITVISRWKLKAGVPEELANALKEVASHYEEVEPGTLVYCVNLSTAKPLDPNLQPADPPPPAIPSADQTEVVFVENYRDAEAFAAHVNGEPVTEFRTRYLKHFIEAPDQPGWPKRETLLLEEQSGFSR